MFLAAVQVLHTQVALADDEVVAEYDAGDRGEKDGIRGEVGGELVRGGFKFPLFLVSNFFVVTSERGTKHTGHMAKPMAAQMYPPRLMVMYRGSNAVMSVPADTEFAAMLDPN